MIYHFQGDSIYSITNPYTRRGDTLRIVLDGDPPEDPFIETIVRLRAHHLHLHVTQPHSIDSIYDYAEYDTFLKR
ncbi:hypothetical protein [Hymenobacter crusticola]|nr:hypothetical protein [Hymenobacter crusticola]